MYRVELKGLVRNYLQREIKLLVPNVPCGVERTLASSEKGCTSNTVPNVPCGVESGLYPFVLKDLVGFLMYRVELKVATHLLEFFWGRQFLMYRVELKDRVLYVRRLNLFQKLVPNVPCGVERPPEGKSRGFYHLPVPNVPCGVESFV